MLRDKLQIRTDERAVSPVLGVALLIAVTVILAAVIAAVVLGVGADSATAPQATMEFEVDGSNNLQMTHKGGDTLDAANLNVKLTGTGTSASPSGTISTGDTVQVGSSVGSDTVVRIVWEDPNSDKTALIAEYEA